MIQLQPERKKISKEKYNTTTKQEKKKQWDMAYLSDKDSGTFHSEVTDQIPYSSLLQKCMKCLL